MLILIWGLGPRPYNIYWEHTPVWVWVVAHMHHCNTCICILHHSCVLFPWLQHGGDTEGNIQGASCELLSENCESWITIADTGCSVLVLWLLINYLSAVFPTSLPPLSVPPFLFSYFLPFLGPLWSSSSNSSEFGFLSRQLQLAFGDRIL